MIDLLVHGEPLLQVGPTTERLLALLAQFVAQLLGLAVGAGAVSALVALLYRWYVRESVQPGLAVLIGMTPVVVYLGTTTALGEVIVGKEQVLQSTQVLENMAAFAVAGFGAYTGTRVGERLSRDLFVAAGGRAVDADVSEIVQTVGRVTSVRLPATIEDIIGYDPMPESTKEKLAGRRFLFPRRLTKGDLRDRLVARLKTDYGVGHVDLELADDGSVEFLAIGSRAAGIGPTLPPATNAVAIQADPANAASAGDLVQVWETNPAQRVLTGELRGVAGEVVTVAIDAADTPRLDPQTQYKLVTLPVQGRPDREFAALLRAADETLGTATVEVGSDLEGAVVGDLEATVIAITRGDSSPETIPARDRELNAGDTLYLIATPDALRRLEEAAEGTGEEVAPEPSPDSLEPADGTASETDEPAPDEESEQGAATPETESTDTSPEQAPGEAIETQATDTETGVDSEDSAAADTDAVPDADATSDDAEEASQSTDEAEGVADELPPNPTDDIAQEHDELSSERGSETGETDDDPLEPLTDEEETDDVSFDELVDEEDTWEHPGAPDEGDDSAKPDADGDTGELDADNDSAKPDTSDDSADSDADDESDDDVEIWDPSERIGDTETPTEADADDQETDETDGAGPADDQRDAENRVGTDAENDRDRD